MLNILPLSTLALFSCYICFPGCLTCTQNLHHGIEADDSQMCISWPQPLPWVLPPLSDCLLDISTWWPPRHLKISTAPKQRMTFPLKAIYPSILPQRMALHLSGSTGRVLGVILGKIPSLSTPHSWFFSESCWCWLLKTKAKKLIDLCTSVHCRPQKCFPITLTWPMTAASNWSPHFHSPIHPRCNNYNGLF